MPSAIHKCQNLDDLLCTTYPQLSMEATITPTYLTERTILLSRNDDVNAINKTALEIFLGEAFINLAADKILEDEGADSSITNRYPNEYLNSLDPLGLPLFSRQLKVECPIMLL